ncbi:hypothetical protein MCP1_120070 [Candidatus Terasakiella magnetica]|nr:hypothetical protein MCP1_120070 [Candidatus Terasakiella magnetica]
MTGGDSYSRTAILIKMNSCSYWKARPWPFFLMMLAPCATSSSWAPPVRESISIIDALPGCGTLWVILSDIFIFMKITQGTFSPEASEFLRWAPDGDDVVFANAYAVGLRAAVLFHPLSNQEQHGA